MPHCVEFGKRVSSVRDRAASTSLPRNRAMRLRHYDNGSGEFTAWHLHVSRICGLAAVQTLNSCTKRNGCRYQAGFEYIVCYTERLAARGNPNPLAPAKYFIDTHYLRYWCEDDAGASVYRFIQGISALTVAK
jgi:hypothetical protein